jgi:uncharacterized protein (UPF0261 family)
VTTARAWLEAQGYEVLVFHANRFGGRAMEALARDGFLDGVLDATTTEWADELAGGVLSAGPDRLTAMARRASPHVDRARRAGHGELGAAGIGCRIRFA